MGLLQLFPGETDEKRAERRRHEKLGDKLLRKIKAQVDGKYDKVYVLKTITETYKIPLDYVKLHRPEIYEYVKELVEVPVAEEKKMPVQKKKVKEELAASEETAA